MVILYSTHCSKCDQIEKILQEREIKYLLEDNLSIVNEEANKNNIETVPFADINNVIYDTKELQAWIQERK